MAEPKCPQCGANDKWRWEQEMEAGFLFAELNPATGRFELTDYDGDGHDTTYFCGGEDCDFTCDYDEYEALDAEEEAA